MFKPPNDIQSVSSLLDTALKQYLAACSTLDPGTHPIPKSISHLIENELLALDSYAVILRRAKSALARAKNYSPAIVPINSLPSEVLSHIFFLIRDTSCPSYDQEAYSSYGFPEYPNVFLHVCSRWRQVATSSCKLWAHIDIIPGWTSTARLLTRAESLVALAGRSTLELHITGAAEPGTDSSYLSDADTSLFQFIASIAPRLQSIELVTPLFTGFYRSILEACVENCTPGTLTRLIILEQWSNDCFSESEPIFGFVEAAESASGHDSLPVNIPQGNLEALWAPIKTLCLYGVYPPWSSNAYHGLVELRLPKVTGSASGIEIAITEAQLVGILQSSPQLRVLHLGMDFNEPLPKHASITSVCLSSLEVLDLSSLFCDQSGTILRWIVPGPEPPIVALRFGSRNEHLSDDETRHFLARSRPTKLVVSGPCSNEWSPHLLSLSPHLQTLVFRGLGYDTNDTHRPAPFPDEHRPPPDFRPSYLHVVFCGSLVDLIWLQRVLKCRPIRSITLWDSHTYRYGQLVPDDEVKSELLQVCPIVRILDSNEPNPVRDWDLDD